MAEKKRESGGRQKRDVPDSPTFTRLPIVDPSSAKGPLVGFGESVFYAAPAGMSRALDEIDRAAESRSATRDAIRKLREGVGCGFTINHALAHPVGGRRAPH